MGLEAIALAAASLLGPFVAKGAEEFAKTVGLGAAKAVGNIADLVRARFGEKQNDFGEKALERTGDKPEDTRRIETLAEVIREEAESDPAFAAELTRLVEDAKAVPELAQSVKSFTTNIGGDNLGNITNVADAGSFTVGSPRAEPRPPGSLNQ